MKMRNLRTKDGKNSKTAESARSRSRPSEPSYKSGKATKQAIIAAAEAVLVRHGHSGFTLKRVADVAGIAVGNLSYHFPTKDSLLGQLINNTLAEYSNRFDLLIQKGTVSGPDKLGELVEWFMDDSTTSRYTHLFRELWAAALHSPPLNRALQRFYDRSIAKVLALVESLPGEAGHRDIELIVYLMCVISEGSTVVFGAREPASKVFQELKQLARRAVTVLAMPLPPKG